MKNRYLKGAHLSERRVRDLLKLFCEDLTATQIANVTGISRITVNAYLKLIRTHLANYCEEKNPDLPHGISSLSHADDNHRRTAPEKGVALKKSFYGIYQRNDLIFTERISLTDRQWLSDWLKGRVDADVSAARKHRLDIYQAVADFNTVRLHHIREGVPELVRSRNHADAIDYFWSMLKSRLVKFRGVNGGTLFLHVKETEFRYNYRNSDLYELLIEILQKKPLHYSRQREGAVLADDMNE